MEFVAATTSMKPPTPPSWQQTKPTSPKPTSTTTQSFPQYTEASSAEIQEGCTNGAYYPHAECNFFYVCFNDKLVAQSCAPGLMYNVDGHMCDWSFKVKCGNRKKIAQKYTILYRSALDLQESKYIYKNIFEYYLPFMHLEVVEPIGVDLPLNLFLINFSINRF